MAIARKLLTGLLMLTPLAGAADAGLLDFIMPDARVVFGVDIARIRSSPFQGSLNNGVQNANPELRKLMEAAGFDPMRDLQEVLFASPGIGKNPPALVVARGTFDATKLRSFAESAGSKITDFGGVPILSDPEKDSGAFALLDNMILAGNREQVEAALGRRGRGMILNTEMATRIAALSQRYDAWLVSIAPLATMAANLPPEAKMEGLTSTEALRSIEQFSLGIGMSADLSLAAEMVMTNAKAAESLADGVQMLLGMLQKGAKEDPGIMAALQNLNFGVDQNKVHIGFTVPAAEVEKAVAKAFLQGKQTGPLTAARRPAPEMPPTTQAVEVHPEPVAVAAPEVQTTPVQAAPVETAPVQTTPAQAAPVESAPVRTAAVQTPAVETAPVQTAPVQTAPVQTAPVQTAPVQTAAVQTPVVETAPVQTAPVQTTPAQIVPEKPVPAMRVPGPVTRSPRIPANGEILIQSSPKDMGTVVIMGSKK